MRVNEAIRAREVRLVDSEGKQVGIVPLEQARRRAEEAGLDLVEVAPDANPPVCKIIDYSKLQYELKRREREARKRQRHTDLKEVKMRPTIDRHDYEIKLRRIKEFLEVGHKVKVTIMFRGREMAHTERGRKLLEQVVADVGDRGTMYDRVVQVGRQQHMILAPTPHHKQAAGKATKAERPPADASA